MPKSSPPTTPTTLAARLRRLEQRHRALLAALADCGLVLPGSLGTYGMHCGKPRCRCHADPPQLHGPYALWTRKVAGKTLTVRLRPEQVPQAEAWHANWRRLRRTVDDLQALGLEAAQALLETS